LNTVEDQQVIYLRELFTDFVFQSDTVDSWRWVPDTNGIFSVKSCYNTLLAFRYTTEVEEEIMLALRKLWNTDNPSKVQVFGWRLLLKRLPTRAAISSRGILINPHDLNCVFCSLPVEDTTHLFFLLYF
jgi:hypothetical protein